MPKNNTKKNNWSKDISNTSLGKDLKKMLDDLPISKKKKEVKIDKRRGEQKRLYGNQHARKYPILKPKLNVGDKVWLLIPTNGTITKIGKSGYSIKVDKTEGIYSFFSDEELKLITPITK